MTREEAFALVRAGRMVENYHPENPNIGSYVFLSREHGCVVNCLKISETVDENDPAFLANVDRYAAEIVSTPDGWTAVDDDEAAETYAFYQDQLKGGLVRDLP